MGILTGRVRAQHRRVSNEEAAMAETAMETHEARNEDSDQLRFAVTYVLSRVPDPDPGRAVSPPVCGADLR
jgi:hypothetical protein